MKPQDITNLKKNAMALRNIANLVLAQVEQIEASASTKPVSKIKDKRLADEVDLTTRLLAGTRKPTINKKPLSGN